MKQPKREPETIDTVMDYVGSDIISYTENYLEDMKVVNHSTMIPLYFSSVGAHIVNLLNVACAKDGGSFCPFYGGPTCGRHGYESHKEHFLEKFGQVPDTRVHLMHIAPAGYSKDTFMQFFTDEKYGFLNWGPNDPIVPNHLIVRTTEAGYTGSIVEPTSEEKRNGIQYKIQEGLAKKYCSGVLAIPEFYAITMEGKMDYSSQMENALLEILDKGRMNKNMARGEIDYYSYHTLWSGTQPGKRFDVSSGLGRRLNFYFYSPTDEDRKQYLEAQKNGYDKRVEPTVLNNIRNYIYALWSVRFISKIAFTKEYIDFRDTLPIIRHTDLSLADNLAMGYNYMTAFSEASSVISVGIDERLKRLLLILAESRRMVSMDNKVEWLMFREYLKDKPVYFYEIVQKINEKQLLTMEDAVRKLNEAVKQGIFGSFAWEDERRNTKKLILYDPRIFSNAKEALEAWEKER